MLKISAIIMASGISSRMGANKLFLEYEGKTFLEHTLQLIEKMNFFEQILVVSPKNLTMISSANNMKVVVNDQFLTGQSSSVRLGTQVASGDGFLYLTIDQPLLDKNLLASLVTHYSSKNIVFPINEDGEPSSPMYFGKRFREELIQVTGPAGGRNVRNKHPEAWCKVQVKEPKRLIDIDTSSDYNKLVQLKNVHLKGIE